MKLKRSGALALITCALCASCSSQKDSPEETFRAFLRHSSLSESEQAWALILPEDRASFEALGAQLTAQGITTPLVPHDALLIRTIVNPYAIKKTWPGADANDHQTTIHYELLDGRKGQALMVREGAQWYIKLRDTTPPPTT